MSERRELVRHYEAAVSAEALALAWARQEHGPAGATVVVDTEISPRGRNGRLWPPPARDTLAVAVVLRPAFGLQDADAVWLLAGLVAAAATRAVSSRSVGTWWPDRVVDPETGVELVMTKAEVQLGPGRVRSAVITLRFDLAGIGIHPDDRAAVLDALAEAVDEVADFDAAAAAARYSAACAQIGRRVKLTLFPRGETRGRASVVDHAARLHIESTTGMVERIAVDVLRDLEVV
ncbi:MAG: hypothetical protein H0U21_02940 [Acidimicrobiia bacterium]|nr:hypothetical protein [Acidimicrobiia bacterium]